jgi:hypothetical protein
VDSQSAKTTGGGEQRGFDGGKKVRGRKRYLLVDKEGLVVEAKVHSANVPDQDGIRRLLEPARSRLGRLSRLWMDASYRGRGKEWASRRSVSRLRWSTAPRNLLPSSESTRRTQSHRHPLRQEASSQAHAPSEAKRLSAGTVDEDHPPLSPPASCSGSSWSHRRLWRAGAPMGCGHNLRPFRRGLRVSGLHPRCLQPQGGRLVDGRTT